MDKQLRRLLGGGLAVALMALGCAGAGAQSYPSKPVRAIVPFGTGGNTDAAARILSAKLSERWGQQVMVENRTGADGNIGTEAAVKAPPDGYTLYFATQTLTINRVVAPSPAFDPLKDLAPIAQVGVTDFVLGVHPSVPVNSLAELIKYAKDNPGKLRYGATSYLGEFAVEQFNNFAGLRIERVPYRNMANVQVDLLAGRIEFFFTTPASVAQYIAAGKLKALGVTSEKPLPTLPNVKSIASELPGLKVATWYAVLAPLKTPPEIIAKVNADLRWALEQPDVREGLEKVGVEVRASSPQELHALMLKDVELVEDFVRRGVMKVRN